MNKVEDFYKKLLPRLGARNKARAPRFKSMVYTTNAKTYRTILKTIKDGSHKNYSVVISRALESYLGLKKGEAGIEQGKQ